MRMGDTTIVCGIKAEIAEPSGAAPDEGFVGESSDSLSSAAQRFQLANPSPQH